MRKIYFVSVIVLAISILINCISNVVFAGYEENDTVAAIALNETDTTEKLTNIVNYSNNIQENENINNQTIIIIPFNEIEYANFNTIKQLMLEKNASVLMGYTTFSQLLTKISNYNINVDIQAIAEMLEDEYEFVNQYNNNGFIDLRIEDDNQLYFGGFFTKAQDNEIILKNYNMYKGYESYDIVEGSEQIIEIPTAYSTPGNYELRFYWSSSTSYNKIYASASTSSSVLVNLYRSEMIQNLVTESSRTYNDSSGGTYYENFVKVQANNSSGTLVTGYYLRHKTYNPNNGDEGWGGDDNWYNYCYTLNRLLQSAYNNDYQSARTGGHVFYNNGYYGVRIKNATSIYNSSGTYLRSAPVGSAVWVSGSNKCGYSNPQYMSINAYSSSGSGSLTTYSSTTFVDAGLLTSNPANYNIDVRWW